MPRTFFYTYKLFNTNYFEEKLTPTQIGERCGKHKNALSISLKKHSTNYAFMKIDNSIYLVSKNQHLSENEIESRLLLNSHIEDPIRKISRYLSNQLSNNLIIQMNQLSKNMNIHFQRATIIPLIIEAIQKHISETRQPKHVLNVKCILTIMNNKDEQRILNISTGFRNSQHVDLANFFTFHNENSSPSSIISMQFIFDYKPFNYVKALKGNKKFDIIAQSYYLMRTKQISPFYKRLLMKYIFIDKSSIKNCLISCIITAIMIMNGENDFSKLKKKIEWYVSKTDYKANADFEINITQLCLYFKVNICLFDVIAETEKLYDNGFLTIINIASFGQHAVLLLDK